MKESLCDIHLLTDIFDVLLENEPGPDIPGTIGKGLDIRFNALHITGQPITQCSTSRLFAYITHYGAQPLGLEWINDHSCNVVFSDAAAARLAIEYLCPAVSMSTSPLIPLPSIEDVENASSIKKIHDTGENVQSAQEHEWSEEFMQSILFPRKAQRIPGKLYNAPEKDAAKALQEYNAKISSQNGSNLESTEGTIPEIYREMEEEDRQRFLQQSEQKSLQNLRGNLWIRWTVESLDVKGNRSAQQSKWYRDHGRDAGKEVVSKVLQVGGADERKELLPGQGRRRGRGGRGTAMMDELDREMDAYRDRSDDAVVGGDPEARRRRRRGSRSATTMAALDEEMETIRGDRRDRSASPIGRSNGNDGRNGYSDTPDHGHQTTIRVRGRGKMRAPSAWDDDRDLFDNRRSGLLADRLRIPADRSSFSSNQGQTDRTFGLEDRLRLPGNQYEESRRSLDKRLSPSNPSGSLQDRLR